MIYGPLSVAVMFLLSSSAKFASAILTHLSHLQRAHTLKCTDLGSHPTLSYSCP